MAGAAPTRRSHETSRTLDHIESYPIVHSAIETFKANPYGAKSIDLTQSGYAKYLSPLVPYAAGPYSYVEPYVNKADYLASSSLDCVDQTFPLLKSDPQQIKAHVINTALLPLRLAHSCKERVLQTYSDQYRQCGGHGYADGGKAIVTTALIITADSLVWLTQFLSTKKQQGTEFASKMYSKGQRNVSQGKAAAAEKVNQKDQ